MPLGKHLGDGDLPSNSAWPTPMMMMDMGSLAAWEISGRTERGGSREERQKDREEMEDRRMETHRETQERGEREGHGPRETAVGPQRGREGQEGEMGHRSASLRPPLTPPPVPGPPTRETSLMWASRSASWGWSPYRASTQWGEPCSRASPTLGSRFALARLGWGLGQWSTG